MEQDDLGFDTRAIHAGQHPDPATGARAMPIYATTSYVFEDTEQAAGLFALDSPGNIYTRIMNPTTAAFEERIASLEGGLGAVATASGQAAEFYAVLNLCQAGDEVVSSRSLYGGTFTLFDVTLRRLGIDVSFVDIHDPDAVAAAITPNTKLVYGETIGNPRADILDIATVAEIAHDNGLPLVVDNTFATPYLCRPIEHGADIVVHSATKFISGHGTVIAGVVVDSGGFPFDNGKFPLLTEPSPAYHNMRFWDRFADAAYLTRLRVELLRDIGAALSPFNSFLLLLGLETLSLRMDRHVANARAVAEFLATRDAVSWVAYPIFPENPFTALAERYLPKGPGAVFTFGLAGGFEAAVRFIESVQLCSHLANVGDAKTLVIHPASTTHQQVPAEDRERAGIDEGMVRISVGLENVEDIIADLERALAS
jgi:O-acetylhomoserine (thiol)-lyase